MRRREFINKSLTLGAMSMLAPSVLASSKSQVTPINSKDDISIAQWALVNEIRKGEWKTLDFPKVAREDFDINGIEFVNTLFEVPHVRYLNQLKQNAEDHGVEMVLIMVDAEGEPCSADKKMRKQFEVNHRKWIDIAHYLGCHSIRTNCRGKEDYSGEDALKWAAESYNMLLEYAIDANVGVVIENHGGFSDNADWMVSLIEKVNNLYFGSYPDWRNPDVEYDNVEYVRKMTPYAKGMSYRNQPTEELSAKMIKMVKDLGYSGWFGIESSGRDGIRKGKEILTKYLNL
ncbi:MAG: sugar phosphate isomerase/epimerase family protein [Bacteroidales bacterium]